MHKPYRRLLIISSRFTIALVAISLIIGLSVIGYNNRDIEHPSEDDLSKSLEASIVWLVDNKEPMLAFNNPILWYFLHRSAQISGDLRVKSLVESYYDKYIEPKHSAYNRTSLWKGLFEPEFKYKPLTFYTIDNMNYYSQHFVYAIYCDEGIGSLDSIKAQNEAEFCGSWHLLNPTCTTHQLMGIRFLQQENCGDPDQLSSTVEALQSKIVHELTYDPRVLDVYIQRVMMLIESGSSDKVKNIWIHRILEQQHADGGWGNFQPLISLDDEEPLYIGLGHGESQTGNPRAGSTFLKIFSIGQPQSTFHATAQGTLLLTLLTHNNR